MVPTHQGEVMLVVIPPQRSPLEWTGALESSAIGAPKILSYPVDGGCRRAWGSSQWDEVNETGLP